VALQLPTLGAIEIYAPIYLATTNRGRFRFHEAARSARENTRSVVRVRCENERRSRYFASRLSLFTPSCAKIYEGSMDRNLGGHLNFRTRPARIWTSLNGAFVSLALHVTICDSEYPGEAETRRRRKGGGRRRRRARDDLPR